MHANLTGQQDVLAGLGHGAVSGGTHKMAPSIWAAPVIMFSHSQRGLGSHVGVVTVGGLVLDVGGVDGDAASFSSSAASLVVAFGFAAERLPRRW
jgi:hypothetical protein